MQMKVTLQGWYNWDNTIFDGFTVPSGLDKETAINTILMRCGEFGIIYSNPDFLKFAITNWSERHQAQFTRMVTALTEQYNPIHNYDRYEEYTDEKSGDRTGAGNRTGNSTGNVNANNDTENTVSADNAEDYQPDNKSTGTSVTNTNTVDTLNENNSENYNEKFNHDAHLYGNIGVTTSMSMVADEIDLRYKFGIYDLIAAKFVEEFCIAIY